MVASAIEQEVVGICKDEAIRLFFWASIGYCLGACGCPVGSSFVIVTNKCEVKGQQDHTPDRT
jgi:hypothetical protein